MSDYTKVFELKPPNGLEEYVLSHKAEANLDEIYVFSYQTFGEVKADAYYQNICERLNSLASNPHLGRSINQIQVGLLCKQSARHIIFYTIETGGIFVVRILHDSMDITRHIPSDHNG